MVCCAANMKREHDGSERRLCVLTLSVCAKVGMERRHATLLRARGGQGA
jgi:hypothetical protein